jgi:hypothetical protein
LQGTGVSRQSGWVDGSNNAGEDKIR